jgi:prolyl-tRNA synthetase
LPKCEEIRDQLKAAGIRVKLDADEEQTPGWKFSEYEMRGVPLRLEIGPKDIEKNAVFAARRDTRQKQALPMDGLAQTIKALLARFRRRCSSGPVRFARRTPRTASYDEFKQIMEGRPGFVIAPWCESATVRDRHQGGDAGDDPQHAVRTGARRRPASSAASPRRCTRGSLRRIRPPSAEGRLAGAGHLLVDGPRDGQTERAGSLMSRTRPLFFPSAEGGPYYAGGP